MLSPDHANHPLPVPSHPGTSGRSSPTVPKYAATPQADLAGQIYAVSSDGHVPGFIPSPTANGSSQRPVIPQNTGSGAPYRPSSEKETSRSRSPISFYATSPVPAGVTYPAPPVSRSAGYHTNSHPQSVGSNPSLTSEGRRRHDSLSATAGVTPSSKGRPIQTTGSGDSGGHDSRVSRRQSNASLASQQSRPSYSRYDPNVYNDPAYLASNDSLVDSVTGANTAANGGGGPVRPVRVKGSPAYMYTSLRTNE